MRHAMTSRRALAAVLLGVAAMAPVTTACSTPAGDTEQVEESDQMSGDTDSEETEADSDTEE